MKLNQH